MKIEASTDNVATPYLNEGISLKDVDKKVRFTVVESVNEEGLGFNPNTRE